jgi:predicted XRE-type DNA-binding protein
MSDEVQSFTNVWDAIADTPEEAANLRARADLILAVGSRLTEFGWSQTTAARNLGITQPRVSDLICGKISKFSLDTLVNLAARGDCAPSWSSPPTQIHRTRSVREADCTPWSTRCILRPCTVRPPGAPGRFPTCNPPRRNRPPSSLKGADWFVP